MKLTRMWRLSALLFVFLSGCQMVPSETRPIPYEGGQINIQQAWPLADLYWQQSAQFTTAQGEQTFLLSAYLRSEENLVVALTPTGYELFRVRWSRDVFEVSGAEHLPDPRLPMRVIADMQLALWPLSALENEVKGLHITEVLEEVLEPHWQRTVSDSRGRDVLVIQAEEGPLTADEIHIRHESYQLTIRTIERELTESTND